MATSEMKATADHLPQDWNHLHTCVRTSLITWKLLFHLPFKKYSRHETFYFVNSLLLNGFQTISDPHGYRVLSPEW